MKPLATLNALRVTNERFRTDLVALEEAIDIAGANADTIRQSALPRSAVRSRARVGYSGSSARDSAGPYASTKSPRAPGLGNRVAPPDVGAYRYDEIAIYEGLYLFLRHDFTERDQIHCNDEKYFPSMQETTAGSSLPSWSAWISDE